MARAVYVFCMLIASVAVTPVYAAPEQNSLRWSWWGELEVINYDEPGVMQEEGLLYGIAAAVEQDIDTLWSWRLEASWVYGDIEYDGATVNLVTGEEVPAKVDTPNTILNARLLAARRMEYEGRSFRPYAGVGYRLLIDDLPGDAGYTREQTYWYLPLGIEAGTWSPTQWRTGLRVEFDWLIRGMNDSSTDLGFVDADVTQDTGYGFQLSLSFVRVFSGGISPGRPIWLTLEPFIQYWDIDRSDSDTDEIAVPVDGGVLIGEVTYIEPDNTTEIYGIRASIDF